MRFRRKAKLFPGIYLNFSKSGISTTLGIPGASINIGNKGAYLNTGIPGTGLYDRKKIGSTNGSEPHRPQSKTDIPNQEYPNLNRKEIKTNHAEVTTTHGLQEMKKTLLECYDERIDLKIEIEKAQSKLNFAKTIMIVSHILIFGFFIKWFNKNYKDKEEFLADLILQLENCVINIDMDVDNQIENKYQLLLENYKTLLSSEKIWDITSLAAIDSKELRSAASESVTRKSVQFGFGNIDIIKSKYDALHFENANGGDLYFYPAFLIIVDSSKKFGLIDIREINFNFCNQHFIEEEKVPNDAIIVEHTWAKVNKNGTPDKRFKDNYEIPICKYGKVELSSQSGLNEAYIFSSFEKTERFANAMNDFKESINNKLEL